MASVKVAVRVRPFNQREKDMGAKLIVTMDGRKTRIENSKVGQTKDASVSRTRFKDFTFDHSYWSFNQSDHHYASQEKLFGWMAFKVLVTPVQPCEKNSNIHKVFEDLGMEVVDSAFEGYNACVFAYGQTGSGKTFTMMGTAEYQGLIPRICKNLFGRMYTGKEQGASYRTEVSYLEIYNERVKDLLHRDETGHGLRVREHPRLGPYVQDLSHHLVSDYANIQELMVRGNNHRTTACTNMNDVSSRSHAIFTLMFVQAGFAGGMPSETVSKVHLVDLAGSERADATGATGQRLKEGAHINKSLVTLGSVISALAEHSSGGGGGDGTSSRSGPRSVFIPYRDSVLTWLLKDSLGGNSKTIMIAAISPADCNYGETLSTLRYANRAKNIINKPTINEDPNVKLIRELRDEITKLRALLGSEFTVESQPQMVAALQQKEAQEKVLTEEWTEKWRETQQILHEQKTLGLRKSGVGVVLDSDRPHLVGIDDDLLSTGVTLYHLKEGETSIGGEEAPRKQDIVLNGIGVEPEHCSVVLKDGVGTLIPKGNAQCWVNTVLMDKPTRLSQGCIIVLGRTNMFRYNDPAEAAKMRKEGSRSHLNLSRLSLLSWSTSDLDWSSENLPMSVDDSEKADDLEVQRATLLKEKEAFKREQAEKELDWEREQQKKKEALETAQKELEEERQQMELEYQVQKRRLAEDWQRLERSQQEALKALKAREAELLQKKEDLMREREKEAGRAEAASKCISALKEEMDFKREALRAFVVEKMREIGAGSVVMDDLIVEGNPRRRNAQSLESLEVVYRKGRRLHSSRQECCSRRRSDPVIACCSRWRGSKDERKVSDLERLISVREIMTKQRQELAKLETELQSKLKMLSNHNECLEKIESELHSIDDKQNEVKKLVSGKYSETVEFETMKQCLAQRTQEQLESIAHRKQSLTLDLQSVNGTEESSKKKLADLSSHETFHTANSDCPIGENAGWEDDAGFMDASRCGSDLEECAAARKLSITRANSDSTWGVIENKMMEEQRNEPCNDGDNLCVLENTFAINKTLVEPLEVSIENVNKHQNVSEPVLGSPLLNVKEVTSDSETKSKSDKRISKRKNPTNELMRGEKDSCYKYNPKLSEERELGEGRSFSPRDDLVREDALLGVERIVEGSAEKEGNMAVREAHELEEGRERWLDDAKKLDREVCREESKQVKNKPGEEALYNWQLSVGNELTIGKAEDAMRRLCAEVEHQKALILQSLQKNCDKEEINHQILILQDLQRQYVRLEYAMESPTVSSPVRSRGLEADGEGCDSDSGHFVAQEIENSLQLGLIESGRDQEGNLINIGGGTVTRNCSSIGVNNRKECRNLPSCNCICNGEFIARNVRPLCSSGGSFSESRTQSPSNPILYKSMSIHGHPRCSYGNLSLGRSMSYSSSLLTPICMDESDPTGSGCGVWVQILTYHLRGSGSSTHYEYEVKVAMEGDVWTLLRRYRRFRQLHLSLKAKYGAPVERIPFPPRKFFGKNLESVAKTRRKLLEVYLRHLLSVCSQIESCPLYSCRDNPSRLALFEFSSFFRVSIFDSGKFGTG